jgi:hypothetical protein
MNFNAVIVNLAPLEASDGSVTFCGTRSLYYIFDCHMDTNGSFFRSLNVLLFLTGLTYATTWLPFVRGLMDGESYSWGNSLLGVSFSGSGIGGDFYYIVINTVLGILLMFSFYWVRQRLLFYTLLIVWHGSMIANAFYEVFAGQGYYFHGDTLGLHLNLSYVILPFMVLVGSLAVLIIVRDRKVYFKAGWTKKNNYWLMMLLIPLPVQYFLLSAGDPHGTTDQAGVTLALLQVLLVSRPLKAYAFDYPEQPGS